MFIIPLSFYEVIWALIFIQDDASGWKEDLFLPRQSALNLLSLIATAKVKTFVFRNLSLNLLTQLPELCYFTLICIHSTLGPRSFLLQEYRTNGDNGLRKLDEVQNGYW